MNIDGFERQSSETKEISKNYNSFQIFQDSKPVIYNLLQIDDEDISRKGSIYLNTTTQTQKWQQEDQSIEINQSGKNDEDSNMSLGSVLLEQTTSQSYNQGLQESQLMQGSVMMDIPQGSVMMDNTQGSVMMDVPQGSIMMDDIKQRQVILDKVEYQMIRNKDESGSKNYRQKQTFEQQQWEASERKENFILNLRQLSLLTVFDPLDLQISNQIKLRHERRIMSVNINGACFGRSRQNDYVFTDSTKVSSKHAKIQFHQGKFYLKDLASKRGTFLRIEQNFSLKQGMQLFVGDILFFEIISLQCEEQGGDLIIKMKDQRKIKIKMQKDDCFTIGRDKKCNLCFEGPQFELLSNKHISLTYRLNCKHKGKPEFVIDDLNSRNGTWLRLSEKQTQSELFELKNNNKLNFAFEIYMDVVEIFYEQ